MQPRDLVDGKFKVGLDCCEIDLLGTGTRPGEAIVTVWHALGMPDDGCSVVNPRDAILGIATTQIIRRPSRYGENPAARRGSRKNCLLYGSHRLPLARTRAQRQIKGLRTTWEGFSWHSPRSGFAIRSDPGRYSASNRNTLCPIATTMSARRRWIRPVGPPASSVPIGSRDRRASPEPTEPCPCSRWGYH